MVLSIWTLQIPRELTIMLVVTLQAGGNGVASLLGRVQRCCCVMGFESF